MSLLMFGLVSMCWFFFTYVYYLDDEQEAALKEQEMANRGELPSPKATAAGSGGAAQEPKKEQ